MSEVSVEDRVLIRELYDRFYMALNDGDGEAIMATFAPDGFVEMYDGTKIRPEFSVATGDQWSNDPVGRTYQHHVTNVIVEPDPEGREDFRTARAYILVTGVWDPPHVIIRWGFKADDLLQRVDGRWRIARRRISLNHESTGPHWSNEPAHPEWDFEQNRPLVR